MRAAPLAATAALLLIPASDALADATITFSTSGEDAPYQPAQVTIAAGELVSWQGSFSEHPLRSDEGLWPTPRSGTTFSHRFTAPGTFRFHCAVHPDTMRGSVTVSPAPAPATEPAPTPAPGPLATPMVDTAAPQAAYAGARRLRGLRPRVTLFSSEPGRAAAVLTVRGRRLGTGTAVLPSAGRHAIRVALNRRGRAKLRRAPRIRVTLTLVVTDSAGNAVTLRRRLTLVR